MTKNKQRKIDDFDKTDWKKLEEIEKFDNKLEGKWVQKGPYIENSGGKLKYGIYVGVNKRLVGVDDKGRPILKDI